MLPSRILAVALAALLLTQINTLLFAQMQPHARLDGELLPIVTCANDHLNVLKNGNKQQTQDMACHIRPGTGFAEGFVEVADIVADLDPLKNMSLKDRSKPGVDRFRYRASLVADRNLSNCYALLTFVTEGSIGTQLIPVGGLGKGKAKAVKVELPNQVDAVGSMHVFSNGQEVRSTQHREKYDVTAYYADLTKDIQGLSAAELFKSENVYAHALSADGRFLAALRLRDAKKIIIVYDLESMKLLCEAPVAESDDSVRDLTWVSDHEVVYVAEEDFNGDGGSENSLYLLDAQTGQTKMLAEYVYGIISSQSEKLEEIVLFQSRWGHGSWTNKYNVRTGKSSDLNELFEGGFYFDRNGNTRIHVRYEGDKIEYSFRPKIGASWRDLDEAVKQPGLRFNVRGAEILDRVVDVHSIGPDGDTLYISTRLAGADRFELAAFSMSEGIVKRTIAKHPKYDLTTGDFGLARLLFAKNSPQLLGIIYQAQKPQVVWLDPKYAGVQKSMDVTFPDHVNLPIDWSKDGATFVYLSTSEQDPGTYYVFKPLESRLIPLLELGERFKGKKLAKTEAFEFAARDGKMIPAYVTRPTVPSDKPSPLIVSIHGGPTVRDGWGFNPENQYFASRGYTVLQVNYRGSSGYGAAFQNAGLRARLDTVILDDIADGARYLIDRKEVDPERVVVMGGSFGGWATYMSLIKYPELYRAGIATAAVSNWRRFIKNDRWTFGNKIGYTFWKALLDREDFAASEKFIDPYLRAAEIKQPVYIIHGEWDTTVGPDEAKMMLDALRKNNANVQSRSFAHASHTYWRFDDRVVRLNEMSLFLDRALGKPVSSAPLAGKK